MFFLRFSVWVHLFLIQQHFLLIPKQYWQNSSCIHWFTQASSSSWNFFFSSSWKFCFLDFRSSGWIVFFRICTSFYLLKVIWNFTLERTSLWSLPELNLFITEQSVTVYFFSVRMHLISLVPSLGSFWFLFLWALEKK